MAILEESRLVVEPQMHFLLARRFAVTNREGKALGEIVGGSIEMELIDSNHVTVALFSRPWVLFNTVVDVATGGGEKLGSIVQVSPWGRVRFELLDVEGGPIGDVTPTKAPAVAFDVTLHTRSVARIEREIAFFFRTGTYLVDIDAVGLAPRLFAIGSVLAIDKAIDRRRGSSAPVPAG